MKFLLDSHTWLWLSLGIQLNLDTVALCRAMAASRSLFLSPLSVWELSRKGEDGGLAFDRPVRVWMYESIRTTGVMTAAFDHDVAIEATQLPRNFHKDPIDRALAASCRVHGMTLLTRDHRLLELASQGVFAASAV
ncbi:type II toxin-antitoxin system VapC family toxin [Terriglobus aquaticus]|uniref:Type II toxin-antitoxin system VapC family toxin n=1 Tax=Terriglobus aquaticus TaxID=940139 RepID=A0ABW9KK18_9BACT|nr:PIN domain-containing protein [Terriglobus aquaticus]